MTSHERHLPMLYGGADLGPRPATRANVCAALERGVDPVVVAAHVLQGTSDIWAACLTAMPAEMPKPACSRGCAHCCHQRVEITAPEAFLIARALRNSPDERVESVWVAAKRHAGLSSREHFLQQCACPFLDPQGACSIYEVRPSACRRAHSLDVEVCRTVAAQPALDVRVPCSDVIDWNTSSLVLGYLEGLAHAGRPPHHYELAQAVALALHEDAEQSWLRGEDPLANAQTRDAASLSEVLHTETARGGMS